MKDFHLRSPSEKVGGLVYFGRMLDKICVQAKNELPDAYQPISARASTALAWIF